MKAAIFEYAKACSVAQACSLLAEHGSDAKLLAGAGGEQSLPVRRGDHVRGQAEVGVQQFRRVVCGGVQPEQAAAAGAEVTLGRVRPEAGGDSLFVQLFKQASGASIQISQECRALVGEDHREAWI